MSVYHTLKQPMAVSNCQTAFFGNAYSDNSIYYKFHKTGICYADLTEKNNMLAKKVVSIFKRKHLCQGLRNIGSGR